MMNKKIIHTSIFCFLILVASMISGCTGIAISANDAGLKARDYLDQHYFSRQNKEAEILSVRSDSVFYEVELQIVDSSSKKKEDKLTILVTKDGQRIILSQDPVYDMTKSPQEYREAKIAQKQQESMKDMPKKDKPDIQLFVMSGCPFGVVAENVMSPVIKHLGKDLKVNVRFIVSTGQACFGKYCSMHGVAETEEDARQICVSKHYSNKFWPYLDQFNKDCSTAKPREEVTACSEKTAKALGIDNNKIKTCIKDSDKFFAEEEAAMIKFGAQGSPSLFVNGVDYNGPRTPNGYLAAICNGYKNPPAACSEKIAGGDQGSQASGGCGGG